jgi:peptidyl-prolyl cis-trans isomerase D
VEGRGLTLGDVDLGEVTRDDLGAAAAEVFALEEPGVVGPVETPLGPALIRVNAILEAREIPLAEVEEELSREVSLERARRELDAMVVDLDDRLAAGATLEDLAGETAAEVGTLDFVPGMQEGVAAYDELRAAAEALTEDDFPRIEALGDGGLFALRLDEVIPPRTPPLEEVRAEVAADWRAAERRAALVAMAEEAAAALRPGDDLGAVAQDVQRVTGITRDGFVEDVPDDFLPRAFALEELWETTVVEGDAAAYLVQVEDIRPVQDDDPRAAALRQGVLQEAGQSRANDVLNLYGQALLNRTGIEIEQSALNAVHSQVFN